MRAKVLIGFSFFDEFDMNIILSACSANCVLQHVNYIPNYVNVRKPIRRIRCK
jgi:hypothetical protein